MTLSNINRKSFLQSLLKAQRGEWLLYHVGYLLVDRDRDPRLNTLACAVYDQYEKGNVVPVQKRHDGAFWYYVVKL